MRWSRLLAVLVLAGVSFGVAAPVTRAQTNNGGVIRGFVLALNNGDLATASSDIAPDFTLTFIDGSTANGTDALNQIVAPITIISVTPAGNHQVNAVLQFGSDAPMNVSFTGASGMIETMTILGPA